MARQRIIVGTRGSKLAMAQTHIVAGMITEALPRVQVELQRITTRGDDGPPDALARAGGKGAFTAQLEAALRSGRIDLAVHSAKDLPAETPDDLDLLLIPPREDARDAFVSRDERRLMELPAGATIGTSSLRRQAALRRARPDLQLVPMRGNVDTRLAKLGRGECDAIVLAAAGLKRAGLAAAITEILPPEVMLPAPGQGALAVQGRRDDGELRSMLAPLDDADARAALACERRVVALLEADCATPIGVWARRSGERLVADGFVVSADGVRFVRATADGPAGEWAGVADRLVERLRAGGGEEILHFRAD